MSLVITSSRQQQYDGLIDPGVEKPYSYKNHMKSPLIIKKNSEIAVVSVRVDRPNIITVNQGSRFGLYWGKETVASDILGVESDAVVFLQVPPGDYSIQQFADAVQTQIINVGNATFSNFRTAEVETESDADDEFVRFKIKFSQNASATNVSATLSSGSFSACVDSRNDMPVNPTQEATYGAGPYDHTDDFSASGNKVTSGSDTDIATIAILATDYLSSTSGVCEFNFSDADATPIKVGLVRNMPEDRAAPSNFNDFFEQDPNFAGDEGNRLSEFYDYVFDLEFAGGGTVPSGYSVGQAVVIGDGTDDNGTQMVKVPSASYTNVIPNASFDSSKGVYFNKVRFTRIGQQIKIEVVNTSGNASTLIDAGSGALKPVSQSCDLLYAKLDIGTDSKTIAIDRFDRGVASDDGRGYNEKRLYGFDLPNREEDYPAEYFSEYQDVLTNYSNGAGATPDSVGYVEANLESVPIYSTINASGGQERSWVLILAPDEQYNTYEIAGEMIENDDMKRFLGFSKSPLLESGDKDTSSKTNDIVFKSDRSPNTDSTESMFIRWNATQQQSYNGNQGSISKIIYACPRFDIRGSTTTVYITNHLKEYM